MSNENSFLPSSRLAPVGALPNADLQVAVVTADDADVAHLQHLDLDPVRRVGVDEPVAPRVVAVVLRVEGSRPNAADQFSPRGRLNECYLYCCSGGLSSPHGRR